MCNLRHEIANQLKRTGLSCNYIEEQLMFKKGDISKFIYSDWWNLDESFSPFHLSIYLNIPVEEYHEGYYIDFNGREQYMHYMNQYFKNNSIPECYTDDYFENSPI